MKKNSFFIISVLMICIILFNAYIQSYKYIEPLTDDRRLVMNTIMLNIMNDTLIKELIQIWLPNAPTDSYTLDNYGPIKEQITSILSDLIPIISKIHTVQTDSEYIDLIERFNENENNDFNQYREYVQDTRVLNNINFSDDYKNLVIFLVEFYFDDINSINIKKILEYVNVNILNADNTINESELRNLYEKIKDTINNIIIDNNNFYNVRIRELAAGVTYNEILSYINDDNDNDDDYINTITDNISYITTTMTFV